MLSVDVITCVADYARGKGRIMNHIMFYHNSLSKTSVIFSYLPFSTPVPLFYFYASIAQECLPLTPMTCAADHTRKKRAHDTTLCCVSVGAY